MASSSFLLKNLLGTGLACPMYHICLILDTNTRILGVGMSGFFFYV
jgi:hypothetical protein